MGPLLVLVLLFGVMYAAMIRPQQKRAREHQALMAAVEVGDEVMTTAGIFGRVTAVEGDVISIEISPGVVMRVARAAIGRRMDSEFDEPEDGESFDDLDELDESLGNLDDESLGNDTARSASEPNGSAPTSVQTPEPPTAEPPTAEPPPTHEPLPTHEPPLTPPPATPGAGSAPEPG
ncbi:MAG: preprotein translocase subunit YajC [Acidimicrobiia bacterium]|nr:preprotein translocase subunit YajC [Acidimicrobiia bacterium]